MIRGLKAQGLSKLGARTWLQLPVSDGGYDVYKHAAPFVCMHNIAARLVLLQPRQHRVAQGLIWVCLHHLSVTTQSVRPTQCRNLAPNNRRAQGVHICNLFQKSQGR